SVAPKDRERNSLEDRPVSQPGIKRDHGPMTLLQRGLIASGSLRFHFHPTNTPSAKTTPPNGSRSWSGVDAPASRVADLNTRTWLGSPSPLPVTRSFAPSPSTSLRHSRTPPRKLVSPAKKLVS